MPTLNENIRTFRVEKGLNQVEFAKALGVTKQCVSNWENDNVMPSVEMLIRIADYFMVTTDFLLGRAEKAFVDVSGLTNEQISHLSSIIQDLSTLNNTKNKV